MYPRKHHEAHLLGYAVLKLEIDDQRSRQPREQWGQQISVQCRGAGGFHCKGSDPSERMCLTIGYE